MISRIVIWYGSIALAVVFVALTGYAILRYMRKRSHPRKPHVMKKINDFYRTQDDKERNVNINY